MFLRLGGCVALSSFSDLHFPRAKPLLLVHLYLFFSLYSQFQFLFPSFQRPNLGFFSRRDNPKNQQVHLIIIHTTRGQPRPCFDNGVLGFFLSFLILLSFLLGVTGIIRIHLGRRTVSIVSWDSWDTGQRTWEYGSWIMDIGLI